MHMLRVPCGSTAGFFVYVGVFSALLVADFQALSLISLLLSSAFFFTAIQTSLDCVCLGKRKEDYCTQSHMTSLLIYAVTGRPFDSLLN